MSFTQTHYRARNDDGSESAATWKAALDTPWSQNVDENFRVRIELSEDGESGMVTQRFEFRVNAGSWTAVGAATAVQWAASTHFADGDPTTNQISGATETFAAGDILEASNAPAFNAATTIGDRHSEHEICLQIDSASIANGDAVEIRLAESDGTAFGTYTNVASMTALDVVSVTGSVAGSPAVSVAATVVLAVTGSVAGSPAVAVAATLTTTTAQDFATAFREYPVPSGVRVSLPPEWSDQWGDLVDAHVYHPYTDADPYLRLQGNGASLAVWSDVGDRADVDVVTYCVPRVPEDQTYAVLVACRASGSDGAEDGYLVEFRPFANTYHISEFAGGSLSALASKAADTALVVNGVPVWCRFQAIGTAIKVKVWHGAEGDEPGSWGLTTTDATLASGKVGVGHGVDCYYFALRSTGDQAPVTMDAFGPSLSTLLKDPREEEWEWTVEAGKRNPDTDAVGALYLTSASGGRGTHGRDRPGNTRFYAGLRSWPSYSVLPSGDFLLGGLARDLAGTVVASNRPPGRGDAGPHDGLLGESMARREVVVRVGRRGAWHRSFTRALTGVVGGEEGRDGEPEVTPAEVRIPVATSLSRLRHRTLERGRFFGIPTALDQLTGAGTASVADASELSLTEFTLMRRVRLSSLPGSASTLFRKGASATDRNYSLEVNTSGRVKFSYSSGGVAYSYVVGQVVADGEWHSVFFAFGSTAWYCLVDGRLAASGSTDGAADQNADALTWNLVGQTCDARIYGWYPDQIQGRALVDSLAGVVGLNAWWKLNDGTGATVTDYSSGGNNATLAGVESTDYEWVASDGGEPEVTGRPYPILYGAVNNAPAMRIDAVRDRFHFGGSGKYADDVAVRDQGDLLAESTDYAEEGDGVLDFVDPGPGEPVTVQWPEDSVLSADEYAGPLAQTILEARAGEDDESLDEDAAFGAGTARPFHVGYFSDSPASAAAMLEEVIRGVGLSYWEDRYGRIVVSPMLPPTYGHPDGDPTLEMVGYAARAEWWVDHAIDPDAGDYSITAWVRPVINGGGWVAGNERLQLSFLAPQGFTFNVSYGTSRAGTSRAVTWRRGLWFFIGAVWDRSATEPLIFGGHADEDVRLMPNYQQSAASAANLTSESFMVGLRTIVAAVRQRAPVCGMGRVSLWDKELSLSELQGIKDDGVVGNEPNLLLYAPLSDRHADGALDLVSGQRAKVTGARWTPKMVVNLDLSQYEIVSYKRINPAREVLLRYARNHAPLDHSDVVAATTQVERLRMTTEWEEVPYSDNDVADDWPAARSVVVDSTIRTGEHASQAQLGLVERLTPGWYALDVSGFDERALSLSFGDEVQFSDSRLIGSAGRSFRVVAVRPSQDGSYSVAAWG